MPRSVVDLDKQHAAIAIDQHSPHDITNLHDS
jgi:hypothetical protein